MVAAGVVAIPARSLSSSRSSSLMPDDRHGRACFIVKDRNGQALAYIYFEDKPGRRTAG